jgi:betaine lipid synthase
VIPPFLQAVDQACSYLHPDGIMGVADFFVSSKYDLPMRQMSWLRRFFWRCVLHTGLQATLLLSLMTHGSMTAG